MTVVARVLALVLVLGARAGFRLRWRRSTVASTTVPPSPTPPVPTAITSTAAASGQPATAESNERAAARGYAEDVLLATRAAAATAARCRADWEHALGAVERAWDAYEAADQDARRSAAASAYPTLSRRRSLGENALRQRNLHRTALVACRAGDISVAQLNEVLAHRGWNPRLHPVAQEDALRRATRTHRFARYQAATRRERIAWRRAETAAAVLASLRQAALTAQLASVPPSRDQLWWADEWTDATLPLTAVPALPRAARSTVDAGDSIAA